MLKDYLVGAYLFAAPVERDCIVVDDDIVAGVKCWNWGRATQELQFVTRHAK